MKNLTFLILILISISFLSCSSTKLNGLYVTNYSFGVTDLNSEPNIELLIDLINSNYFESSVVYLEFKKNNDGIRYFKFVDSKYSVPFRYHYVDKTTVKMKYYTKNMFDIDNFTDDLLYYNLGESVLYYDKDEKSWYYTMPIDNNLFVIYTLKKIKKL